MEKNKMVNIAGKVRAGAIAFIGAGILSQGTFYFKVQSSYNIPRILYPVYKILGNRGLAVSMIILGLALLYYGFVSWKKISGNVKVFGIIGACSLAVFFSILLFTGNRKVSTGEFVKISMENREKEIADMKAMDQPDFGNKEIDKHFADFETHLQQYKDAIAKKDEQAIRTKQADYQNWDQRSVALMQKLPTIEQKQQMSLYMGKLALKWQEVK